MIRLTVWFICLVALLFNCLVLATTFSPRTSPLSPARLLVALLASSNLLTGVYVAALTLLDAVTWGSFAEYGGVVGNRHRVSGGGLPRCVLLRVGHPIAGFSCGGALLGCEGSNGEGRGSAVQWRKEEKTKEVRYRSASVGTGICCSRLPQSVSRISHGLSSLPAFLWRSRTGPRIHSGPGANEHTSVPAERGVVYTRLYCRLGRAQLADPEQAGSVRHIAWLIFTNCVFFCPVAAFSFAPLLVGTSTAVGGPEMAKSVTLIFFPLSACLNPVLYVCFSPSFRYDWLRLRERGRAGGCGRLVGKAVTKGTIAGGSAASDNGEGLSSDCGMYTKLHGDIRGMCKHCDAALHISTSSSSASLLFLSLQTFSEVPQLPGLDGKRTPVLELRGVLAWHRDAFRSFGYGEAIHSCQTVRSRCRRVVEPVSVRAVASL